MQQKACKHVCIHVLHAWTMHPYPIDRWHYSLSMHTSLWQKNKTPPPLSMSDGNDDDDVIPLRKMFPIDPRVREIRFCMASLLLCINGVVIVSAVWPTCTESGCDFIYYTYTLVKMLLLFGMWYIYFIKEKLRKGLSWESKRFFFIRPSIHLCVDLVGWLEFISHCTGKVEEMICYLHDDRTCIQRFIKKKASKIFG